MKPFVVINVTTAKTGVVIGICKGRNKYTVVIPAENMRKTTWSMSTCQMAKEITPEDIGFSPRVVSRAKKPDTGKRFGYFRNIKTWSYGAATRPVKDGDVSVCVAPAAATYKRVEYLAENCESARKEEYVESVRYHSEIKKAKTVKKTSGRICKDCGKKIDNGNWWYCGRCYTKRLSREVEI